MAITITARDVFWNYVGYFIQYSAGIFLLPVALTALSKPEFAVWQIFLTVTALVNMLDLGFQPAISRNISYILSGVQMLKGTGIADVEDKKNINYPLLAKVIETSQKIYLVISIIALLALLFIGSFYINFIANKIEGNNNVFIAWIIQIVACVTNLYFLNIRGLLIGYGKIAEAQKAVTTSKFIFVLFAITGLIMGHGLVAIAIANAVSGLVLGGALHFFFYDNKVGLKLVTSEDKEQSKNIFKKIWPTASRQGIVSFGSFLILRANIFLISFFLPLDTVGQYGLCIQIFSLIMLAAQIPLQSFIPFLSSLHATRNVSQLKQKFSLCLFTSWISFIAGSLAFIYLGPIALTLIKSNTHLLPIYYLLFMGLIFFLEINHSIAATFITTSNRVPFVKASLISGVCILFFSFLLLQFSSLELLSVLLSSFFVQLAYNNWKWPHMVFSQLSLNVFDVPRIALTELKESATNRIKRFI